MNKKNKHHSLFPPKEDPVHIPPVQESWALMRQQLDTKMPVRSWYSRSGRWPVAAMSGAVVAVLSFLIWQASHRTARPAARTYPGISSTSAASTRSDTPIPSDTPTHSGTPTPSGATTSSGTSASPGEPASAVPGNPIHTTPAETSRTSSANGSSGPANRPSSPASRSSTPATGSSPAGSRAGRYTHSGMSLVQVTKRSPAQQGKGTYGPGISEPRAFEPVALAKTGPGLSNSFFRKADSLLSKLAASNKRSAASNKTGTGKDKKAGLKTERGLRMTAGLSATEYFPIGQQKSVSRNGKGSLLWDYLPAPYFRFYADDKIYLEGTARIISPQDIRAVQIDSTGDTVSYRPITGPIVRVSKTTLTKLYYTDLSLTAHYRLTGGLYIGAGLEFSRLTNGIATKTVTDQPSNGIGPDTPISSGSILLKTDPTYGRLRKDDWRMLFEVSYQWKRFTAALRYQKAISSYIPVMPDGSRGKEKNAAFGFDLRYDLWQRRRHK